ncbi:GNAT family N-acetyltransferase [Jiangella anatolica]|uniref:GNAT family N-acetyltransferase n=1 Tax=Jiangella anatolica TaxID=2670374 RepID=A0A2W2BD92_9ACTN|nr:GNAT family N-acetyltransferase [Jiangella anatolica]PZF83280.1 GNAT family N-acetyltransferase [Jiangella anatolica]
MPTTLTTDRLTLRPIEPSDADAFAAMNADPAVMEHFTTGPLDRAASDRMLARMHADHHRDGYGLAAVERRADGAFLGFTGIHRHHWYPDDVEIGWRLARSAWGQGYATEAATAWMEHAFGELALPRLISITVAANQRSIAVMRRLGFTLWEEATHDGLAVVVYARSAQRSPVGRRRAVSTRRSTSDG